MRRSPLVLALVATIALASPAGAWNATNGSDVLQGNGRANHIDALAGHDQINSRGGRDVVLARAGDDTVTGGSGDDRVQG